MQLEVSGKHYLGFVSTKDNLTDERTNDFESRRNYFQLKAYFNEDPKSYMRITLDTHHVDDGRATVGKDLDGTWNVRLKYAYLYLNNILPNTGVEFGQVHRPWIDYEEHHGWWCRSISKVMTEADNGAHLTNSADLGFNLKTKTPYFSSEIGLFNGEGYHGVEDGEAMSLEWRATAHLMGNGKDKMHKSDTYANASFFGQLNEKSAKHGNEDLNWYGIHAVYNQPEFLIAAQYIKTKDAIVDYSGSGYSINGSVRFRDFSVIGRYDNFELDSGVDKTRMIAGLTYQYNKNVEFIANVLTEKMEDNLGATTADATALMFTAEVNW